MGRVETRGTDEAARATAIPPAEPSLHRIVALAADLFDVPAACLVLRRQEAGVVVASVGLDGAPASVPWTCPLSPGALAGAAEATEAAEGDTITRPSSRVDYCFYAEAPVMGPDAAPRGALCVMADDGRPAPSPADMDRLRAVAGLAADIVEALAARGQAEATAVAKAGLLADVSHEMRTPLNAIVGFTQLLRRDGGLDGVLNGEARRAIDSIDEAGRGLLAIVGDALDLARFESGLVRLDLRAFSPARLVEDAAALVRGDAKRKGLRLVVDLPPPGLGPLLGDPGRLRQIVLNLLANAVKFTASGTVRVALSADPPRDGAVPLTLSVEDSGVGIDADGLSRLFQRFAQADGAVARRFGGTGLGLAISKTLVEAMGGGIAVEAAPGVGARFTVTLALPPAVASTSPAPARAGGAADRPADPATPSNAVRDSLRGLAVLVADDAAMNQRLVLQMLEPLGAEVDVVADGAAAVAAVARRAYALVLMDMEMPVLGGLDATRQIRALGGAAAGVPIVALTANAFPEQLDLCRESGMDDHLVKPFSADDLSAKVLRWARRGVSASGGAT